MSERDYNTGADSVVTTDPYVIVRENDSYVCDIKVKGSTYQKLSRVFSFRVKAFELNQTEKKLLIYLAFSPKISRLFSPISQYGPSFNSVEELEAFKQRLWAIPLSTSVGSPQYSFQECSKQCGQVEDCFVRYCDRFTLECKIAYLDQLPCENNTGVCVSGSCVPRGGGTISRKCPDVQCISSECTTRYLDEDTCTCKETRLNGKQCDGGKGICDNGVCKPKDSYFASATSVTITLEAPYENGTIKRSKVSKRLTVSNVPGHDKYLFLLGELTVGTPPITRVKIIATALTVGQTVASQYNTPLYSLFCYEKSSSAQLSSVEDEVVASKNVVYACDLSPWGATTERMRDVLDLVVKDIEVNGNTVRATVTISFHPIVVQPKPVTQTCSNVQCSDDLPNCRVASCYDGKCQYAPAPVGTPCGENSYCNAQGECVTQRVLSSTYAGGRFILVYMPLAWNDRDASESFNSLTDFITRYFVKRAGLSACRDKVDVVKLTQNSIKSRCASLTTIPDNISWRDMPSFIEKIESCAASLVGLPSNADNYRIVALTTRNDITIASSSNTVGFTDFGKKAVFVTGARYRGAAVAVSHEIGHTFDMCEQYSAYTYKLQRNEYGCTNYYPGPVQLDSSSPPVYMKCSYNTGSFLTNCPEIRIPGSNVDCMGRRIPYGDDTARSLMGTTDAFIPRAFDCFELDAIKSRWSC
jgi:hypothetical protein